MPQLRTKVELATLARAFAIGYSLVEYEGAIYMPVHFMTKEPQPQKPEETVWMQLDPDNLRYCANILMNILFATPSEEVSFKLMLRQLSTTVISTPGILVRVGEDHVERLTSKGELVPVTGDFMPNYLDFPYDPKNECIEELFAYIEEWVGSKAQADSLLHHVATALQPTWSARRYVLLIGSGMNGKSTFLTMILHMFGEANISGITRLDMASKSPIISDLNGRLLNVVLDGPKDFLKDSSTEKTLIAGERLIIKLLYENHPFRVQTNALFIEGLQQEPRVSDKSKAVQDRLVRYYFPNTYSKDLMFEEKMYSPQMIAALFHLLLAHWVNKNELDEKLAKTAESTDLQMEAVWVNTPVFRFLEWTANRDPKFLESIVTQKMWVETFMDAYRVWCENNGYKGLEDDYLLSQLKDNFEMDRKTFRVEGKPTTKRYIKAVRNEAQNVINLLLQGGSAEGLSKEDIAAIAMEG